MALLSCNCFVLLLFVIANVNDARFTREPKCGDTKHFRFDEELPTYHNDVSYCKYYRGETCCNRTHTEKIVKHIHAYHEPNVSAECREVGLNIGCSPCDPRVGTNQITGICEDYCNYWYDVCRDDFFHYNKRGLLTACSQSDLVCTKLHQIINNGSQLCRLSGYDVSYTAITCYNGIKSKFKAPPTEDEWETAFSKVSKAIDAAFKNTRFHKNIQKLLQDFAKLGWWQKVLVMAGIGYTILAVVKLVMNVCSSALGIQSEEEQSSEIPSNIFDEAERAKIRQKRLEKLAKNIMVKDSENLEANLAKTLGMEATLHGNSGDHDEHVCNHDHGDVANEEDDADEEDDTGSDDADIDDDDD